MNKFLSIFFVLILNSLNLEAQIAKEKEDHNHKNEVSLATGIVPLPAEDKVTAGFHFHYIRGVGESRKFGIGVGLETILDEHKHYTVSVVFHTEYIKALS